MNSTLRIDASSTSSTKRYRPFIIVYKIDENTNQTDISMSVADRTKNATGKILIESEQSST